MPNVFLLDSFNGEYACLNEEECAHLRSVRVRENEVINVTDGKGKLFECIVIKINKKTADLKILKIKNIHCSFLPEINLFIGASKWDRMQILIEKAVEH
ncbi:MAG TPA: RsmE family RNA methyltransferase, partial [Petrotogaceae bacterium]|nr:RsmE family RNA methyltransferase [Petrotogaceae bacterium]HQP59498.1 RsmE family RNA methyltransferase [Petrotogaceae bacterium]